MDPFDPFRPVTHPCGFFGFLPTLFDAPSRDEVTDTDWTAHSFLTRLGDGDRNVGALHGFSWGFSIQDGVITPRGPELIGPQDWEAHRKTLGG